MMKPLVLGMGPSAAPELTAHSWHPLAPTSLYLAKIVFDDWLGLPRLEACLDLDNLNETCHRLNGRDAIDPVQAERTMDRLIATESLVGGRHVILLGCDVQEFVRTHPSDFADVRTLSFCHPSNLGRPSGIPRQHWSDMRHQIRRLLGLPDVSTAIGTKPRISLRDYPRPDFLNYLKRYKIDICEPYVGISYHDDIYGDLKRHLPSISSAQAQTEETMPGCYTYYSYKSFQMVDEYLCEVVDNEQHGWPYPDDDLCDP